MRSLIIFAPEWLTVWFAAAAAGALILGFKQTAYALMAWPVIDWIVLPIFEPVIDQQPAWVAAVIIAVISLIILQGLLALVFGKEAAGHVIGTYLVRLLDLLFIGPLRFLGRLWQAIYRGR